MRYFCAEPFQNHLRGDQQLRHQFDQLSARVVAARSVADLQSTTLDWDHGYWKRRYGKQRLLAKVVYVDQEPILCFLEIFDRRSPAYSVGFRGGAREYGSIHLDPLCTVELVKGRH